jgi:DNA-binding IclR family transcriptional regulator
VAAVSISGWTLTMTAEKVRELVPSICRISGQISKKLGYLTPQEC